MEIYYEKEPNSYGISSHNLSEPVLTNKVCVQ